ncbi:bifunctional DNA primase/polymerase [Streptomyces californicus]|uniref:bifunctional DNA primase/polymerase n=1 Tax=Streptomyces californicus TaxID=67351 RepID=UPI0009973CFF|nr:bifunctional DNA primase/polymerase [Streptomyces californicus]
MTGTQSAPGGEPGALRDQLGGGSLATLARDTLDVALWLVSHNFPVFPADHPATDHCTGMHRECDGNRGKHPCVPFTRQHTTDPATVHQLFAAPRNVGVAVGACTGPDGSARLLVVDSDRHGAIEEAAAAFGHRHESTMRVSTAKGYHDYYWAPASLHLGNGLGQLRGKFDGDVRSGNAYVIGPGSLHATGVLYEVEDPEHPPMYAPAWLLNALHNPPAPPAPRAAPPGGQRTYGDLLGLVTFVLDSQEGQRNERLFWAACRAFEHAAAGRVAPNAVADALADAATRIGLSDTEARAAIRSAYRSGATR